MAIPRDFTFAMYGALLDDGLDAGYDHLTVREYLRRAPDDLPDRFVVHRHDVDRKPANALRAARIEADRGVRGTYYFRTIEKTFEPGIIRAIADLGHEIGYHYEDLDRASGDVAAARDSFADHLRSLRSVSPSPVDTVCMHGNPLTPHDNRDMWGDRPDFAAHDLLGEAYLSMDFTDVTYFSDTGRTWRDGALKVKDHPVGDAEKRVRADTTDDLRSLLRRREVDRACLLSHPNRWAATYPELLAERAKDAATNLAKRGLTAL